MRTLKFGERADERARAVQIRIMITNQCSCLEICKRIAKVCLTGIDESILVFFFNLNHQLGWLFSLKYVGLLIE